MRIADFYVSCVHFLRPIPRFHSMEEKNCDFPFNGNVKSFFSTRWKFFEPFFHSMETSAARQSLALPKKLRFQWEGERPREPCPGMVQWKMMLAAARRSRDRSRPTIPAYLTICCRAGMVEHSDTFPPDER